MCTVNCIFAYWICVFGMCLCWCVCLLIFPYLELGHLKERHIHSQVTRVRRVIGGVGWGAALSPIIYQWRIKLFVRDHVNMQVREKQKASLSREKTQEFSRVFDGLRQPHKSRRGVVAVVLLNDSLLKRL